MSWFISNDGRVECLDDGPRLPWWLDPDEADESGEDQSDECDDDQ